MHELTHIFLKGCRQHNLKNFSLYLPKHAITVITGISGSGKSSLAFDTLFAEGQRRYLMHLSQETRALIKELPKPEIDYVEGLAPTLALNRGQKMLYRRGTVATYTEIYDFLSLLYANIGEQHSPTTGLRLFRYSQQEIVEIILNETPIGTRFQLLAPIKLKCETLALAIKRLEESGFVRFKIQGQDWTSGEELPVGDSHELDVVVDRLEMKEEIRERLANSIETVMSLSQGILKLQLGREGTIRYFTEIYICPNTGQYFSPLQVKDFNFNSIHGACNFCKGIGGIKKVNRQEFFWHKTIPLLEQIKQIFNHLPKRIKLIYFQLIGTFWQSLGLSEDLLIDKISNSQLEKILMGDDLQNLSYTISESDERAHFQWKGVIFLLNQALGDKKNEGTLSDLPFVEWITCPKCLGARLKPQSLACLIQGQGIHQLCALTATQLILLLKSWTFDGKAAQITTEIMPLLIKRLNFIEQVGLGYLELNRPGYTLSDGEAQRIQLASQIGSKLSGIIYILDEPSLGLHRQDIKNLQQVISELKSLGNTIILVEHERHLIQMADHIVELGPGAGQHGGQLLFQGDYANLVESKESPTGQWLSGKNPLVLPKKRKLASARLSIQHASLHNLKNISLKIPLNCFVGFCGVSGSGKSSLVIDEIGKRIKKELAQSRTITGLDRAELIQRVVISQKKSNRFSAHSIPATYTGLMTPLRQLFAETRLAKARGYTAARFSLNKRGGRCEVCQGLGQIKIHMQLMPDLQVTCDVCQGSRFNHETLQVMWKDLNFAQVLNLSVEQAANVFKSIPILYSKLELLRDLGLDYLTLGQSFTTLSTGEIQRLRLVTDLADPIQTPTLYILDEPSAGLHFQDIKKLMSILSRLIEKGHSIFIIEHHLDILRQMDWLIELGPAAGAAGGYIIFEGSVEKFLKTSTPTSILL